MALSKDREELVKKVINLAAEVLDREGHEALTVRRIAQESNASTQLIYTLFGGKFGLVDGLYQEGFQRMATFLRSKEDLSDPRKNLETLLRGYREFAFRNKAFFSIMFTRPVAEYTPPKESLDKAFSALGILVEAIKRCQTRGDLPGDPLYLARLLWSRVHGVVSLELIGHLWDQSGDRIYEELITDLWTKRMNAG